MPQLVGPVHHRPLVHSEAAQPRGPGRGGAQQISHEVRHAGSAAPSSVTTVESGWALAAGGARHVSGVADGAHVLLDEVLECHDADGDAAGADGPGEVAAGAA